MLETFYFMHRIDPMNRERATADLVDFCDTKLRFGQKKNIIGRFLERFPTYSQRPLFTFQFCSRVIVISDIGISRLITLYSTITSKAFMQEI